MGAIEPNDGLDIHPPLDSEHPPREIVLTVAQMAAIGKMVERSVKLAMIEQRDEFADYTENRIILRFGRKVIEKILWVIGFGALALLAVLAGKGVLPTGIGK